MGATGLYPVHMYRVGLYLTSLAQNPKAASEEARQGEPGSRSTISTPGDKNLELSLTSPHLVHEYMGQGLQLTEETFSSLPLTLAHTDRISHLILLTKQAFHVLT